MYTLRMVCLQSRVNVLQILARTLANVQSYRTIMSAPVILVFTERAAKVNDLALINMTCPRALVSLRGSCRNNALPRSPREKPQLIAILSLDVHNMHLKNLQLDNITWLPLPRTYKEVHSFTLEVATSLGCIFCLLVCSPMLLLLLLLREDVLQRFHF